MPKHELLSGEAVDYPTPSVALGAFLDRMRGFVDDPTITESDFLETLYSTENPLLDHELMPGRGTVTRAVFADPTYHVMLDLLGRKRVALGSLDMDKVRARYSMSVKDAAATLGLHEDAIRKAIAAKRLSSVKVKGEHRLDPKQVANLNPSPRGPSAPLAVVYGSKLGRRLSIRHDGHLVETEANGAVKTGRVERWTHAIVLAGAKEKVRAWRLKPGPTLNSVGFDEFSVSGRFDIEATINNAALARSAFKATASEGSS